MAKKYLDYDGLLYFWQKIKLLFSTKAEGVKTITRSGTTFTVTRADDTTFTFTQQDNTVAKTTTTPKMNGTAAVGSETKYAAGDHVHPVDTSRAPTNHASTATTYGAGNGTNYGHVKLSDATDGTAAAASGGTAATPKAVADALVAAKNYADGHNTFSNVKVGSTTIAADTTTDTLELAAGTNITLTPDATNDKVTIAFSGTIPTVPNNFGTVKVGSTSVVADTTSDTLELAAGSNVTLTPDATNDKVTITATDTKYSAGTAALIEAGTDTANRVWQAKILHDYIDGVLPDEVFIAEYGVTTHAELVSAYNANKVIFLKWEFDQETIECTPLESYDINDSSSHKRFRFTQCMTGTIYTLLCDAAVSTSNGWSKSTTTIGTVTSVRVQATSPVTSSKNTAQTGTFNTTIALADNYGDTKNPYASKTKNYVLAAPTSAAGAPSFRALDASDIPSAIARIASPTFTGTPKAPTATAGTNNTQIATTEFVTTAVANAQTGAATFQGTAPTSFAPTNYKKGYYWIVGTAGTYATQTCEPGDMIFAIADYASSYKAADFTVIQTNLDITSIANTEIDTILAS